MGSITLQGRQRLERLRRANPGLDYSWDGLTWGGDPTGSVALCVDQTSWVVDVRVESVTESMREAEGFSAAVVGAYRSADLLRLAEGAARSGDPERRARIGAEILADPRRLTIGHLDYPAPITMPELGVDFMPTPEVTLRRDMNYAGTSRYREVTVTIRWDCGCLGVAPDRQWLRTTTPSVAQTALNEAFAAAYAKGEDL